MEKQEERTYSCRILRRVRGVRWVGLVFHLVFWVLAGACQRHGVGGFYCSIHPFFFLTGKKNKSRRKKSGINRLWLFITIMVFRGARSVAAARPPATSATSSSSRAGLGISRLTFVPTRVRPSAVAVETALLPRRDARTVPSAMRLKISHRPLRRHPRRDRQSHQAGGCNGRELHPRR